MILDEKINSVEVLGEVEDTQTLTLEREDVAHIFEMLSSSLYSDSVQTTLVELTSNCYDAHIEANKKDVPFEICLPTYFSPVFKIRDFGIGMTKEIVEKYYMKLGKSTKRNTNTTIGAFGLGRWAILGVTDSFILRTSRGGTKLTYSIYRGENGLPNFILVNEEICNDWTGTEIECAVDKNKTSDWTKRIANIVTFYPVIPKVFTDGDEMIIEKPKYFLEETQKWGILEPNSYSRNNLIICGPTSYPIDTYKIREFITDSQLTNLFDIGVHIYTGLGEVAITPNRENLKYNDKTINLIKTRLEKIQTFIKEYVENQIKNAPTYIDAIKTASKLKQNSGRIFNTFNVSEIKWNGLPLYLDGISIKTFVEETVKEKIKSKDLTGVEIEKEIEKKVNRSLCNFYNFRSHTSSYRNRGDKISCYRDLTTHPTVHFSYYDNLNEKIIFLENDLNESGKTLEARLCSVSHCSLLVNFSSPENKKEFFALNPVLEFFKIGKISDYEKDQDYLDQFEKNKRTVCIVRRFQNRGYSYKDYERWSDEEIDFSTVEGYYVSYYRNRYWAENTETETDTSSARVLNDIHKLLDNKPIYGLTDTQIKKAEKSGNSKLIRLETHIKKYLKEKYAAYINSCNLNYLQSHIDFEIGNKYEIQEHFKSLEELIVELKQNYLNGELKKFEQYKEFYNSYIRPSNAVAEFENQLLQNVENIRVALDRKKKILECFQVEGFKKLVTCSKIRKSIIDKMLEAV